ncbi:DUF6444 domain-containing protein [Vibrio metschnikovii]|uniref:DUF6444 domain-containing protein n=1 Tax=Vibrio metschnikovii TaxID=28172 RepID=UPI0020C62D76|nr:DUF6444 domain-containing protein [Vibrio metschnikovii]
MNKKTLPPPPDFDSPEEAKDIIHFLWNKLAELEDRLNQNSRNSSVPSSQQPLHNKAKNTSPNRKKSGKKQGAQPGHKGHRRLLHPIEDSASVEQYLPNKTCHCGGCIIPNRKPLNDIKFLIYLTSHTHLLSIKSSKVSARGVQISIKPSFQNTCLMFRWDQIYTALSQSKRHSIIKA